MYIGPVVDLSNYQEYYKKFLNDFGSLSVLEFHILEKDLENEKSFEENIKKISVFLKDKDMKKVSLHCPDTMINDLTLINISAKIDFLDGVKLGNPEEDLFKLSIFLERAHWLSESLGIEIVCVFHFGLYLPSELLNNLNDNQLGILRKLAKESIETVYTELKDLT